MAEMDGVPATGEKVFFGGLIPDGDWEPLAAAAGGIGRWAMDPMTGLCEIDLTLRRITGLQRVPITFPAMDFIGRIHPEDRPTVEAAIARAMSEDSVYDAEFRFRRPEGDTIWLTGRGRPLRISDGRTILIGVNIDVTDDRIMRDRAELLAGEMAHRLKNVFALVQSMFNIAARGSGSKEELVDAFQGRLSALTAVNALTFSNPERRVDLEALIGTLLQAYLDDGRVTIDLPAAYALNGTAAQTLILALHELLTNAVKHGALSEAGGTVAAGISASDGKFVLSWTETCSVPIRPPEGRGGFGMRVLNSMTKATFMGDPIFVWRPEGLSFSCTWPDGAFRHDGDAPYSDGVAENVVAAAHAPGA